MGWSDAIAEQYSPPPAPPASRAGKLLASPQLAALLILAVAVATRIVAWWNPVPHVDDQFYLLAGQELIDGHWPYVDVWDRKPLGLFLIYAAIAWIGGGSMVALNFIATAFAAATAWVVRAIGLRFASPAGATLGALAYLFTIPLVGGQTGQSPVFYNLLMAGAGWLLIDGAAERSAPLTRRGETGGALRFSERNADPSLFALPHRPAPGRPRMRVVCGLAVTIASFSPSSSFSSVDLPALGGPSSAATPAR